MQNFVVHANIEHFHNHLASVTDARKRDVIFRLLAEEIEKLPPEEREAARSRVVRVETGAP